MIGQEREITRSELIAMGFSKNIVDNLPTSANSNDTEEKIARRDIEEYQTGVPQKSQELIRVREAYIKLDMTGNGKSELRQVITAGNQVLLSLLTANRTTLSAPNRFHTSILAAHRLKRSWIYSR